jgi:Co/Zn/Cd efflux system component
MAAIGTLALAANTTCFALLWRQRSDGINLRSTWLCSRNDLVANGAVLVAAALVARSRSVWPDVLVGAGIAALFLRTAAGVIRAALGDLRQPEAELPAVPAS